MTDMHLKRFTKKRIYNPKRGNSFWNLSILSDFGVLEYWSVGVLAIGLLSFFQHSNTPSLQYCAGTFKNFWQPFDHLFIDHSSGKQSNSQPLGFTFLLQLPPNFSVFCGRFQASAYLHRAAPPDSGPYRFGTSPVVAQVRVFVNVDNMHSPGRAGQR